MKYILLLSLLTGVAASAPGPEPPENVRLGERIFHASEVYYAESYQNDGHLHFRLLEVWRHNENSGPPPSVGAEVGNKRGPMDVWPGRSYGDHGVIWIFKPKLKREGAHDEIEMMVDAVYNGKISLLNSGVDEIRELVIEADKAN